MHVLARDMYDVIVIIRQSDEHLLQPYWCLSNWLLLNGHQWPVIILHDHTASICILTKLLQLEHNAE